MFESLLDQSRVFVWSPSSAAAPKSVADRPSKRHDKLRIGWPEYTRSLADEDHCRPDKTTTTFKPQFGLSASVLSTGVWRRDVKPHRETLGPLLPNNIATFACRVTAYTAVTVLPSRRPEEFASTVGKWSCDQELGKV